MVEMEDLKYQNRRFVYEMMLKKNAWVLCSFKYTTSVSLLETENELIKLLKSFNSKKTPFLNALECTPRHTWRRNWQLQAHVCEGICPKNNISLWEELWDV